MLQAGLWVKDARISSFDNLDYGVILNMAEEQSVVGLVAAGLEHLRDVHVPKQVVLRFVGQALQLEQSNKAMNEHVARLIEKLGESGVYSILVKGQGIAQCYDNPFWRASGDIDLLLSDINYEKAKQVLLPLALDVQKEYKTFKHLGMSMSDGYVVELHGTLHSRLSNRIDNIIDEAQQDVFYGGNVRLWMNENTTVFLPAPDDDVIFIFTHILHHFFIDGIGLRQICDWCRLLWTYRSEIDTNLLEQRLKRAALMSEWKAFSAFAVEYLGMPLEAIPLYMPDKMWSRKAERIMDYVLETGNLGHNRIVKWSDSRIVRKIQSALKKMNDMCRLSRVFPLDSIKFFIHFISQGIVSTIKGE